MLKYNQLNVNQKINLKQYAIEVNKNKRLHFKKPNELQKLNELQIHSILN
jgi:hypothetical protein